MTDDKALPDRFGRYALIERIGRGGMGEVFSARVSGVHGFEKTVAIKRILPSLSKNSQFRAMLIDEAKIACLLAHPNIVQVLELGEVEGSLFLAMEYVDGRSLHELQRELGELGATLTPAEAAYVMIEVLQGLHAAHVQKDADGKPARIIHRDVSPQNVLVSFTGLVKVIDFGIARAVDRLERTQHGNVKGKLSYMAPEQLDAGRFGHGEMDGRVDVFAAGAVLHELLTGEPLFRREAQGASIMAILDDPIPSPSERSDCDPKLAEIVMRMLERERRERPTASESAAALRGWLYQNDPAFSAERLASRMAQAFGDDEDADETVPVAAFSDISTDALRPPAEESTDRSDIHALSEASTQEQRPPPRVRLADEHTPGTPIAQFHEDDDFVPTRTLVVSNRVDPAKGGKQPRRSSRVTVVKSEELRPRPQRRGRLAAVLAISVFAGVAFALGLIIWAESQTPSPSPPPAPATAPDVARADEPTPPPEPAKSDTVVLVVTTSPPAARVALAGASDDAQDAPARFTVRPGDVLELTASAQAHDDHKERVRVPEGEETPSFHLELKPSPVPLRVDVTPREARVTVNGEPLAPDTTVVPGEDVRIVAAHQGAQADTHQRATVGQPLVVSLHLPDAKTAPSSSGARKPRARTTTKPRVVEPAAPSVRGKGTLVLTTAPNWAEVWIDGRRLKNATPLRERLSAGKHDVKLVNEPKGLSRRFTITIEPNKETKKHVSF